MRLSLRARLLIAVAAVALVGLVLADIATYTALRSFLVDRVDESLTAAHRPLIQSLFGPLDRSPGGDAGALADTLAQLFADDGLRHEVGRKARQTIVERFAMPLVAERYFELYGELLGAVPRRG